LRKPRSDELTQRPQANEDVAATNCTRANAPEDADLARRLHAEEEEHLAATAQVEDDDAAYARRLQAEEELQLQSSIIDRSLAATLQGEHGRAGKLLQRADQLDAFLEAPLGSFPLPQQGDLAPETLRRIVALTAMPQKIMPSPVQVAATPSPKSGIVGRETSSALSTFRKAGVSITTVGRLAACR
jgi:hypothetical protein